MNRRVFSVTDSLGNKEQYTYDLWHNRTEFTDLSGQTEVHYFNKIGLRNEK